MKYTAVMSICLGFSSALANEATPRTTPLAVEVKAKPKVSVYGLPPDKVAQSTASINGKAARKTGSDRLEDFADYIPGVHLGRSDAGVGSDIYLRGYPLGGNFHLDGLQDVQGFYLRDPATIERLEISKGLDSVLFGSGSPGGAANYVSKKPGFQRNRTFNLSSGIPEQYRAQVDITDRLKQSDWAGRLVMTGQLAETGRKNVGDDRFTFMPSLLWQTEQQSLLLEMESGWQNREFDFDTVFYQGKPVYNASYVDPRSFANRRMNRFSTTYTRDLGKGWEAKLQASRIEAKRNERWIGFAYLPATGSRLPGYYRDAQYDQTQQAVRTELTRSYQTGQTQHQTRVGFSDQSVEIGLKRQYRTGLFSLDIFDPQFDYPLPTDAQLTKRESSTLRREQAYYLQHHADIGDKLGITAGVRSSQFSADYTDHLKPVNSFKETDNKAVTTSLGITWQATPQWQAFASHNESFAPNTGMDKNDHFFAPLKGVQHEVGLRHMQNTRYGKPFKTSLSAYRIQQKNVTTRDPTTPGEKILTGETRSQGIEATVSAPLNPQLSINLGLNHSDARITENNDGNQGNRLHNVPHNSGSLVLDYTPSTRTNFSLGAVYVGKRPGDDANSFEIPAYTRLDASAEWKLNHKTRLKAGLRNLLDKDYVADTEGVDFIVQGRKRTVTLGVEFDF
jgi:iron complex outermembrane receptor protein